MANKKYISIAELAKILGISRQAVYKKIRKGQIEAIKIGKMFAVPEDFVQKSTIDIKGHPLSEEEKEVIKQAVRKTVKEYGEVLRLLGKE